MTESGDGLPILQESSDVDAGGPTNGLAIDFKTRPLLLQMYGKQGSGKSVLCKSLLYAASKQGIFDWVIVYTATAWNDHYRSFLPEHAVRVWDQDAFYDMFAKIRAFKKANPKKALSRGLCIVDDCLGQQKLYDPRFMNLISTYRHYNVDLWQCQQIVSYGASTLQRTMVDWAFLYRATDDQSIRALHKMAGGLYPNLKSFKRAFLKSTSEKHTAMVFQNGKNTVAESYRAFKCDVAPSFMLKFEPNGL
jgi:ABC-type dipeptide/oligopeptide/nickel transport system ATPase component